jgi:predicted PurR-regulated permease PerM
MFNKRFWTGKNIIFLILLILLLLTLPKTIGILLLFFGAYILACALNPFVNKLMGKMNRTLASSIVMVSSILAIIALFVPIFFVAFKEISVFMASLPEKVTEVSNFFMNFSFAGHKIPEIIDTDTLLNNSSAIAQNVVNHSLSITAGIAQLVIILVALTMIVYYILIDKNYLKEKFLEFFPPDMKDKAKDIVTTISSKVGQYVRAQVLSMVAVGIMVAIVLVIFGVEYSTLLGLISGILDIIPILGPSIALCVILLVAYPLGLGKLILIILGFLVVQQISNYVVRPILFGKMMSLHPLMIFLALFLAQQFLGFWGIIISPAIAATVCVLIDELYLKPINLKGKD